MPEVRKVWERFGKKSGVWKRIYALQKSDWAVLALVGVLLLVIAMPTGKGGTSFWGGASSEDTASLTGGRRGDGKEEGNASAGNSGQNGFSGSVVKAGSGGTTAGGVQGGDSVSGKYTTYMEERLAGVLSQMDGVGRVRVMITVSDAGESVVEKDVSLKQTVTEESDSAGGSRTVSENNSEVQTIYVENGDETIPYIQKEKLPTVDGVVVVAEGAGSPVVISNISESVQALLPVEAHRIKVVKMCSKEE